MKNELSKEDQERIIKAVVIVKNKWTDAEYVHPKIFTDSVQLAKFELAWDTTNTTIQTVYLNQ